MYVEAGLMAATPVAKTGVWTAGVVLRHRVGPGGRRSDVCGETTEWCAELKVPMVSL